MTYQINAGAPNSKANDRITVTVRNSVMNATTGMVYTVVAKSEYSIPRDVSVSSAVLSNTMANLTSIIQVGDALNALTHGQVL